MKDPISKNKSSGAGAGAGAGAGGGGHAGSSGAGGGKQDASHKTPNKKPKSKNPLLAVSTLKKVPLTDPTLTSTPLSTSISASARKPKLETILSDDFTTGAGAGSISAPVGGVFRTKLDDPNDGGGGGDAGRAMSLDLGEAIPQTPTGGGGGGGGEEGGDPEENVRTGEKRKRYITVVEGGKKRKIVDVRRGRPMFNSSSSSYPPNPMLIKPFTLSQKSFHVLIQDEIELLKEEISKESWSQKGKFPPSLKPHLAKLAVLAIKLDEYDDFFFSLMPTLFPYNKFTMSNQLLEELEEQAKSGFEKAKEEWEKNVLAW
ncbi:hypothetical protein H0H93_011952, partial [Arthromyces matolae]